jgi:futalosine hydrolase
MSPDLLIVCATIHEMDFFLSAHPPGSKKTTRTGLTVFSGKSHHKSYDLMITGPGGFNTAHALTVYLEQSSPDLIVQTGIAGIFKETGFNIGDVAIATTEQDIHVGVGTDSIKNDPLPFDLIETVPLSREGRYSFDENMVQSYYEGLFKELAPKKIGLTKGPFITVSTLTSSFRQARLLFNAFSPVMEAMEGAASTHISALYKVPIIEIRAGSNFVGERDKTKWDMEKAVKNLGSVIEWIGYDDCLTMSSDWLIKKKDVLI